MQTNSRNGRKPTFPGGIPFKLSARSDDILRRLRAVAFRFCRKTTNHARRHNKMIPFFSAEHPIFPISPLFRQRRRYALRTKLRTSLLLPPAHPPLADASDTRARQNANKFAFAPDFFVSLADALDTPSRHNQADACFCARLFVSLRRCSGRDAMCNRSGTTSHTPPRAVRGPSPALKTCGT